MSDACTVRLSTLSVISIIWTDSTKGTKRSAKVTKRNGKVTKRNAKVTKRSEKVILHARNFCVIMNNHNMRKAPSVLHLSY